MGVDELAEGVSTDMVVLVEKDKEQEENENIRRQSEQAIQEYEQLIK